MQTFLPYADPRASAACLDDRRLGKQRVETFQVLRAITWPTYGWKHHPVTRMWRGFLPALVAYGLACVDEWAARGHADATRSALLEFTAGVEPDWDELHDTGSAAAVGRRRGLPPEPPLRPGAEGPGSSTGRSSATCPTTCPTSGPTPPSRGGRCGARANGHSTSRPPSPSSAWPRRRPAPRRSSRRCGPAATSGSLPTTRHRPRPPCSPGCARQAPPCWVVDLPPLDKVRPAPTPRERNRLAVAVDRPRTHAGRPARHGRRGDGRAGVPLRPQRARHPTAGRRDGSRSRGHSGRRRSRPDHRSAPARPALSPARPARLLATHDPRAVRVGSGSLSGASPMRVHPAAETMLGMITVESLTKTYGRGLTAVDDVSFTAATGRVTGFLGPNGAGKSTTMRIIVGLTPATSGTADHRRSPVRRPAQPGHRRRGAARRLGPARRPHRPRDPHPGPAHHGPAQGPGRGDARAGQPHRRRGRPPGAQLLARHAPAPRASAPRCSATRTCSSSTSRPTGSTRPASAGCVTCCAATPTAAARCCSPRTCCTRSRSSPTTSSSSATAGSSPRAPRPSCSPPRAPSPAPPTPRPSRRPSSAPGIATTHADGSVHTDATPEQVGRVALAAGLVLTELRTADGAGLEEMFLELTADTQREGAAA